MFSEETNQVSDLGSYSCCPQSLGFRCEFIKYTNAIVIKRKTVCIIYKEMHLKFYVVNIETRFAIFYLCSAFASMVCFCFVLFSII